MGAEALASIAVNKGISTLANLGVGWMQSRKAKKLEDKAEGLTPADFDPRQVALLDDIKRKAKLLGAGKDAVTSALRKDISSNLAKTTDSLVEGTQGNSGALIEGLRKTTEAAGDSASKVASVAANKAFQFTPLITQLTDKIAQRSFDIKMYDKIQTLRQAAEMRKSANENLGSAVGESASGLGEMAASLL